MKTIIQLTKSTLAVIFLTIIINGCANNKLAEGNDKVLYDMARETGGFKWYKNTEVLLNRSTGSGHSYPLLRTRYNSIASASLDVNGKIIPGTVFPEGSLVVKELNESSNKLGRYAILLKDSQNKDADQNGWVWGYINADGTVAESSTNKGNSCRSCHLQQGNINNMLMNIYFP